MLGKVIGNYKLEIELGRGAHGVVYRALDQGRSRAVAVKALHPGLTEKAAVNERLRQLAPSIAQLRHPQLAEFYTILQQGADLYLVTELIEGRTLAATLKTVGVLSAEEAVQLLVQICEPLVWLGRANWAHGNLKPANVMIAADGKALLTDLGLAYALGDQAIHTTDSGLAYRSPEQLQGAGFDTRSDVYALGAMFYELVTGLLPFRRANDEAMRQAHLNDAVPSPRNYFPLIPVTVEALLMRALAKNPEDRFGSAAQFQTALRDWLNTTAKTAEVKNATNPVLASDTPDTNESPSYETVRPPSVPDAPDTNEGPSYETLRPLAATIPELPAPVKDDFDLPPLPDVSPDLSPNVLPDARRHTRPVGGAVADVAETSRLPITEPSLSKTTAPARAAANTQPTANQAGFYDEVVVELDDATPAKRKKGVVWLAVAGLAALIGIPYAMMRNVDSTSPNLPSGSTFSMPSPPMTEATSTPEATLTPAPKATASPRKAKPSPTVAPPAASKAVPKVTPKPLPTATPIKRATPLPTPVPAPTARQIYPPPTPMKKATPVPVATPPEKKKKDKKVEEEKPKEKKKGIGGFFKDIIKGKPD